MPACSPSRQDLIASLLTITCTTRIHAAAVTSGAAHVSGSPSKARRRNRWTPLDDLAQCRLTRSRRRKPIDQGAPFMLAPILSQNREPILSRSGIPVDALRSEAVLMRAEWQLTGGGLCSYPGGTRSWCGERHVWIAASGLLGAGLQHKYVANSGLGSCLRYPRRACSVQPAP